MHADSECVRRINDTDISPKEVKSSDEATARIIVEVRGLHETEESVKSTV